MWRIQLYQTCLGLGLKAGVILKIFNRDFLSSPVVKNPPSNAGAVGSIPGPGAKILRAVGQLSPPCNYEPMCSGARALQREALCHLRRQCSQEKKERKKKLTTNLVWTPTDLNGFGLKCWNWIWRPSRSQTLALQLLGLREGGRMSPGHFTRSGKPFVTNWYGKMVFPIVMYGCQSFTIKKVEHQRTSCGAGEDFWESLGLQGDQSIQS